MYDLSCLSGMPGPARRLPSGSALHLFLKILRESHRRASSDHHVRTAEQQFAVILPISWNQGAGAVAGDAFLVILHGLFAEIDAALADPVSSPPAFLSNQNVKVVLPLPPFSATIGLSSSRRKARSYCHITTTGDRNE